MHGAGAVDSARSDTVGLLSALGRFAASIELEAVPAQARHQASLCVLDTIGCMVLGASTPEAERFLAAERARPGFEEATVFGTAAKLSAEAAARVNGYQGDIFELNDLIGGHASIGTVSCALAMAEALGSSGGELIKAVVAGIETTSRTHAAFRSEVRPYSEIGNAFVGFLNTLGAAAAAASLLRLDGDRTSQALAIAGALAGWCPAEAIFRDGGTVKPILFGGWPAAVGIQGARYAKEDITGPLRLLEGDLGFFASVAKRFDANAVLGSSGKWYVAEGKRKLHACCGYIHAPIDLIAAMRRDRGKDVFGSAQIDVRMEPSVISAVSKKSPPATPNEARFHAQYCMALAAAGADVILPEHSTGFARHAADPEMVSLMRRMRISGDSGFKHYYESAIELTLPGGQVIQASGAAPKGSPANPLTEEDVLEKFKRSVAAKLEPGAASAYAMRVRSLERERDCRWLAQAFAH